jgi:crotonobetainyl-CoA:carnitine CoA-transferase CaiB-like acyl-CoA transferase
MKRGPLAGIIVLDWTQWQLGPVAGAMLGDLGADVIHIEHYKTGDAGRGMSSPDLKDLPHNKTSYFEVNNRGKRSITVNLQTEEGREVIRRLARKADVFLHNYRPGVPERLGIGYEDLHKVNPMLVYAAASGFGEKGPDAGEGALDLVGAARSGASTLLGSEENPNIPLYGGLADQMAAIFTAYGVLAALVARERYGKGQKVDSSMLGSMIAWQGLMIGRGLYLNEFASQQKRESAKNPLWNFYRCRDGKWLVLAMLQSQRYWPDVCQAMELEKIADDPKFNGLLERQENCCELIGILDKAFLKKPCAEWGEIFREAGIISAPVKGFADLADDPQIIANEYIIDYDHAVLGPSKVLGLPIKLSETPGEINAEAPEFGQHTEEVLIELGGYTWDEITELRNKQAI